jgi:ArsR family transcriptional regulator
MKRTLEILTALANKTRLLAFLILLEGDFCVCELEQMLDVEQSCLSHQLRILRHLGLVDTKQKGRWTVYSVLPEIKKDDVIRAIQKNVKLYTLEKMKISEVKNDQYKSCQEYPRKKREEE